MEQSLGADFSEVSVHQNSPKATSIGAYAYTQGNDVHFAPGQFNPETSKGQELLGHELAHVVQQREGRVQPTTQANGLPVNDSEVLESEADQLGAKAAHALPVIRIVAPEGNYDYQNKYFTDTTQYPCPSGLPVHEEVAIQRLVEKAFRALGCRGWARADIMIRASDRQPFLLEINTSPGMTGHSLVPMSARTAGLSYEQLCVHLLASASLDAQIR